MGYLDVPATACDQATTGMLNMARSSHICRVMRDRLSFIARLSIIAALYLSTKSRLLPLIAAYHWMYCASMITGCDRATTEMLYIDRGAHMCRLQRDCLSLAARLER